MLKEIHNYWLVKIQPAIIKFLLFITKGEILYISMAAIITAGIIAWAIASHNEVAGVIELSTFSAVVLEGALVALVGLLRSRILNYTEDPNKLTNDYQGLIKRYSSEKNFVWCRNSDGVAVIPVIHEEWLYDKRIEIEDHPEKEYNLPDIIDKHYEELFSTHLTSKIYNNTNIRVDEWGRCESLDSFLIKTGRTSYYNSLVTNRTMDYELESGISVRELLECGPMVHPLKYSSLSNHLGVNGFVESSDGLIMLVYRKKNVSIGKRTFADSIGASLKTKYALNDEFKFTLEGLESGIILEIEDELGIPRETLMLAEDSPSFKYIHLISAYRDMLEGGKPQFLFYAKTTMAKKEIEDAFNKKNNQIKKTHGNFNRDKNEKEMETDGDELYWIPVSEIGNCNVYSNKMTHKGLDLPMVPSASACVIMFRNFVNRKRGFESIKYSMPVRESYIVGKKADNTCEDAIYLGQRFVGVIDGVTSKGNYLYDNKTSGRYAAEILSKELSRLDHIWQTKDISAKELLELLDKALCVEMVTAFGTEVPVENRLRASIIVLDRKEKRVISYGDCQCKIGDKKYLHKKVIDEELSEKRSKVLLEEISNGVSVDELVTNDPGREAILSELIRQFTYENKDGKYGYPVLNGAGINAGMIREYSLIEGQPVILCTDGYPYVCNSLSESEKKLSELLHKDRLLITEYKSTKGVTLGAQSFDDRAWVKLG